MRVRARGVIAPDIVGPESGSGATRMTIKALAVAFFAFLPLAVCASELDDQSLIDLSKHWKNIREGIATADISTRYTLLVQSSFKTGIKRAEVNSLISHYNGDHAKWLEEVRAGLPELRPDSSLLWNVPVKVIIEGAKFRNEWDLPDKRITAFDGKQQVSLLGGQVDIIAGVSRVRHFDVASLAFTPRVDFEVPERRKAAKVTGTEDEMVIESGASTFVTDRRSGFVRHSYGKSKTGGVAWEIWQFDPTVVEGFVLPALAVRATYNSDETASIIDLFSDVKWKVNCAVPSRSFIVDVPKKTTIVDFRSSMTNPPRPRYVKKSMTRCRLCGQAEPQSSPLLLSREPGPQGVGGHGGWPPVFPEPCCFLALSCGDDWYRRPREYL